MTMSTRCPHSGRVDVDGYASTACGKEGRLCDECKERRADRRARLLAEALALSGLLANPNTARLSLDHIQRGVPQAARRQVAQLIDEGGDG